MPLTSLNKWQEYDKQEGIVKAAVTTGGKREIIIKDVPKPQVQPGTLLLKTKCNSICGTDLEYVDGSLEFLAKGSGDCMLGLPWVMSSAQR